MTTKTKVLLGGLAVAGVVVVSAALIYVSSEDRDEASEAAPASTTVAESAAGVPEPGHLISSNPTLPAPPVAVAHELSPLPADASSVPDDYLVQLSEMVDLSGSIDHKPDKNRWRSAMAVAAKLNQGPCDCAQRNWLTHFLEMGSYALSGSRDQYNEIAALMITLRRNDSQPILLSGVAN